MGSIFFRIFFLGAVALSHILVAVQDRQFVPTSGKWTSLQE